jgi:lysozyme
LQGLLPFILVSVRWEKFVVRKVSQTGLELIKQFEGFSAEVYRCPAGYDTVGYGHLVRANEDFTGGVSETEAEMLLRQDVQVAELAVLRLIKVPLTDGQFDALVSFTYNLGSGALQRSSLRQKIIREAHGEVPRELRRWVWAGGRKLKGLMRRRAAEAALYMS